MRTQGRIIAIVALGVLLAGCRAQVGGPGDDLGDDGGEDLSLEDAGGDQGDANPLCPGTALAEVCGNSCDDDGNGYADDDDPACSTQFLVTTLASSQLTRLIIEPVPHLAIVDKNPVGNGGMALLDRLLAPNVAFLVFTANSSIERLVLSPTGTGTPTTNNTSPAFLTRDVCSFNGELIVIERANPSILHRFMPDGKTAKGSVSLGAVVATSCASNGGLLYVAVHDTLVGNPATFQAYDTSYTQQGGAIPMPAAIFDIGGAGLGPDRCLDFAWSPRSGFWGLFVRSTDFTSPANDNLMTGGQVFPFAFDGGSGPPVDAGTLYGLGSFLP